MTTPPPSLGFTWNQAAPARTVLSPAGVSAVSSSPQTVPPTVSVCCIRSSPPSSLLGDPFCGGAGGLAYASELMTMLDSVGRPPEATAARLVTAQRPRRLSPVPAKSSELSMNSACGVPVDRAGCGARVLLPAILRCAKCANLTVGLVAISPALSITHSSAPSNCGPRMENSSAVMYRLCWSMPILGWSPKHGQPRPPGSVASMENMFHSPSGSFACRTAISVVPTVPVLFRNRITENQVVVAGSYQQRGSLVNSLPPTLNRSLMLNGPRIDFPFVRKMRYAELTGSSTNPLAAHSPWSGGSNSTL